MTQTDSRIVIPLSKKKIIIRLIGALAFVGIGIWLMVMPPMNSNIILGLPIVRYTAGIISILFFGLCAFLLFRKLPDNKPGLTMDPLGIIDNSSGNSLGLILWKDIKNISVVTIQRQKIIMLHVNNPQAYIERHTGGFAKKMLAWNHKLYGTPLSITAGGLAITFDELLNTMNQQLNYYQAS